MITEKELNDFLSDYDIKIINLWYKYDENGKKYLEDEPMTASKLSINSGWYELILNLITELCTCTNWNKVAFQVKEKFGRLCFYIEDGNEDIHNIIAKYEDLSTETCETCGEKGKHRRDLYWWRTLCDKHYKVRFAEYLKKKKL